MIADPQVTPDVLAWPLDKAMAELKRVGFSVVTKEAWLPNRPPVGSELRVARIKVNKDKAELVVVKAQTQPVGNVPPT